jgi:hypothetical protein
VAKKVDLTAVKRKDGRYAVKKRGGGFLNGADKAQYLAANKLIKVSVATPKKEEAAPEQTEA